MSLDDEDYILVQVAKDCIESAFDSSHHMVGCALRTRAGQIFTAVNMDTKQLGRAGVCAESFAVYCALQASKQDPPELIVSVFKADGHGEPLIISPCGLCREMMLEYCPNISVIAVDKDGLSKGQVGQLLPKRYHI